jgi:Na+-driven multidrug efflux pump
MFGTVIISAYGIGTRIVHLFMMPSMGVSHAVTAIVGQNLGARQTERAREVVRKGILLVVSLLAPAMLFTTIWGRELTRFFIPADPAVQEVGQVMFWIVSPAVLFFGLTAVLSGVFQGAGYTVPVMITNLTRIWLFRIPIVYLICMVMFDGPADPGSPLGIWWGLLLSNVFSFLIIWAWYLRGGWTEARIHKVKGVGSRE